MVIFQLCKGCQSPSPEAVVFEFIQAQNQYALDDVSHLLSDDFDYAIALSDTSVSSAKNKRGFLALVDFYAFVHLLVKISQIRTEGNVVFTRETVRSDMLSALDLEEAWEKKYRIVQGKIQKMTILHSPEQDGLSAYDLFYQWITRHYLLEEREMTEKLLQRKKEYLDDFKELCRKYKDKELPKPMAVP